MTRRAKRSGRMPPASPLRRERVLVLLVGWGLRGPGAVGSCDRGGAGGSPECSSAIAREALARLADELRRPEHARVLAEAEHPGDEQARDRVRRPVDAAAVLALAHLAVGAEGALDLPGDVVGHPDRRGAERVAELPRDPVGVFARVEALRPREVVLGLGRVGDLAADAREPEDADRAALVRVADEVELAALEQQQVRVDLARLGAPGLHREVLELDPLAPVDRRVDLGQAARQLRPAGRRGDAEPDRALGRRVERARPAPGDLLEREPQRLGVGELAVEQAQRRLQGGELGVGELDRRQVEGAARERVVLLLGEPVGRLVDAQVDAQRVELRAVGVEAPSEGVLRHVGVAFDVATDLRGGDRTPFRHQVGDQRELSDELLGVLRQGSSTIVRRRGRPATVDTAGPRFLRSFDPLHHEVVTGLPLSLRLVLVEDHQALREGLELLLGREGCTVVGHGGLARRGRGADRADRARRGRGRHPPRRRERHRAHAPAAGRQPGPAHRPLHRRERLRRAVRRAGLGRARLRAQGGLAARAGQRAADGRRRRHVRRPAPAPRAAVAPHHAAAARALAARARDHGPARAGAHGRAGGRAPRAVGRDRQDAHPQRDDQARGEHARARRRDRAARGLHLRARDRRELRQRDRPPAPRPAHPADDHRRVRRSCWPPSSRSPTSSGASSRAGSSTPPRTCASCSRRPSER